MTGKGACWAQDPTSAEELIRRIAELRSADLMLELGRTDDPERFPVLKQEKARCKEGDADRSICRAATQALARVGDDGAFREIVEELKSKDPNVQSSVFARFRYIRGKRVLRQLRDLLDDNTPRPAPGRHLSLPFAGNVGSGPAS